MSTVASRKRKLDDSLTDNCDTPPAKKVWPIFNPTRQPSKKSFRWLPKIEGTCLAGENLQFQFRSKVALFDLDGTLLAGGGFHPVPPEKWKWWHQSVPVKLIQLHNEGFSIVIISNQGSVRHTKNCEKKVPLVASKLSDVPFRIFAASGKDKFRKPNTGTFDYLKGLYSSKGVSIDMESTFFVGDAAGRTNPKRDHSDSDMKYAQKVGIRFFTPEEYFLTRSGAIYSGERAAESRQPES